MNIYALSPDRLGIAAATNYLLSETPESWCWQFGYHPADASSGGREPGSRRIALTLLLPRTPDIRAAVEIRIFEDAVIGENGASYLSLAERAVARARKPPRG